MTELIHDVIHWTAGQLGYQYVFEFSGALAVLLVSLICGMVGSMVVGSRMAFFSDAMAHCAFAGIAFGIVVALLLGEGGSAPLTIWFVPLIMVGFSAAVGSGIAFVRGKTNLATDTVIGVFFAGAIGLGAMLLTAIRERSNYDPEQFIFGSPWYVTEINILYLFALLLLTIAILQWRNNDLIFASVNSSLARSRGIRLDRDGYLFIILLALVVNFSIIAVGVLLINGLLIVPAAAASNLARNMRQMFWLTVGISVGSGMLGLWASKNISVTLSDGQTLEPGPSGPILLLCVLTFFVSMAVGPLIRGRPARS